MTTPDLFVRIYYTSNHMSNTYEHQHYVLNLDRDFDPVQSDYELQYIDFEKFKFPGGESHLRLLNQPTIYVEDWVTITQRFTGADSIMEILLAVDALRREGVDRINLILPYFPGARQDRVCVAGEPLTVKVFADLINSCKFENVYIATPHSDVTRALVDNFNEIECDEENLREIVSQFSQYDKINIVSPDAGAHKRTAKLAKQLAEEFPKQTFNLIRCDKERDLLTGQLTAFTCPVLNLDGAPTIIIDDIVANGGTFLGLGEILRKRDCGPLVLYTTHSDSVSGLENMLKFFDWVCTTNSKSDAKPFEGNHHKPTSAFTRFEITQELE